MQLSSSRETALDLRGMDGPPHPRSSEWPGWQRAGQGYKGAGQLLLSLPLRRPVACHSPRPAVLDKHLRALQQLDTEQPDPPATQSAHHFIHKPRLSLEDTRKTGAHAQLTLPPGPQAAEHSGTLWAEEQKSEKGPGPAATRPASCWALIPMDP